MLRALLIASFCIGLAACGTAVPSGDGATKPASGPPAQRARVGLQVDTVDGTSVPLGKLLAAAVVEELNAVGLQAQLGPMMRSHFTLRGKAETNTDDPAIPFITLIHWNLYDDRGALVGTFDQGVEGNKIQWQYGDPVIIRAVGKGAALPLLAMIREDATAVVSAAPVRAALLVKPILGAPSNGNQMLGRALNAAIQNAGYALTEDPQQAGYVIQGLVDVDDLDGGRQKVRIMWTVTTGDGKEVGRAAQENTLPKESLEGPWDRVAVSVVAGAFPSIDQMLEGAKRYQIDEFPSQMQGPANRGTGPVPANPALPQEPGRAPPPPPG
jgi:hypothetical protein